MRSTKTSRWPIRSITCSSSAFTSSISATSASRSRRRTSRPIRGRARSAQHQGRHRPPRARRHALLQPPRLLENAPPRVAPATGAAAPEARHHRPDQPVIHELRGMAPFIHPRPAAVGGDVEPGRGDLFSMQALDRPLRLHARAAPLRGRDLRLPAAVAGHERRRASSAGARRTVRGASGAGSHRWPKRCSASRCFGAWRVAPRIPCSPGGSAWSV